MKKHLKQQINKGIGTSLSSLWMDEMPDKFSEIYEGAFAMGSSFIGLVVAAFVIYASLKMKELTQWGLAVAASILVMIPCISPCCIIGLPIGIWCLLTLNRPEVKNVFH
jgi:ABC-type proline/glycine betaine transport system permease subunit